MLAVTVIFPVIINSSALRIKLKPSIFLHEEVLKKVHLYFFIDNIAFGLHENQVK